MTTKHYIIIASLIGLCFLAGYGVAKKTSHADPVDIEVAEEEEDESGIIFKVGDTRCENIYVAITYDEEIDDDEAEIKFTYKIMDYNWAMGKGRSTGLCVAGKARLDNNEKPKIMPSRLTRDLKEVPLKTYQDLRADCPDGFGVAAYDPYNYRWIRDSDKYAYKYRVKEPPFSFSMNRNGEFVFQTKEDSKLVMSQSNELLPVKVYIEGKMKLDIDSDDDEYEVEGDVVLVLKRQANGEWSTKRIKG